MLYSGPLLVIYFIYSNVCGAKLLQSCPTLCDLIDRSQALLSMGFSVDGISQARILEWVAIPGDLPDPELDPRSPALQADSLSSEPPKKSQLPAKTAPNAF